MTYRETEIRGKLVVEEIHKVIVHRFSISYWDQTVGLDQSAKSVWYWQQSEAGQFVMKNSLSDIEYREYIDHAALVHNIAIVASLEKKKLTEYYLKFGKFT